MDFERELAASRNLLTAIATATPAADLPLLSVKLKLLWSCNLACRFCSLPEPGACISRSAAKRLAGEFHALGLRKVHFSGGEIFLHPEIHDILNDWASLGIQVNVTSNGTLLTKETIRTLENIGVHAITLSLDSATPKIHDRLRGMKGAHKATLAAARRIAAKGKIRLAVNTVVTAVNCGEMAELRQLIRELGEGVRWKIIPVDAERKRLYPAPEALSRLAVAAATWHELEDRFPFGSTAAEHAASARGRYGAGRGRCHAPWFHLFVAPDGSCYPCCMARGKVAPYGNIIQDGVAAILASPALAAARQETQRAVSGGGFPVCARCDDFLRENEAVERLLSRERP